MTRAEGRAMKGGLKDRSGREVLGEREGSARKNEPRDILRAQKER